MQPKSCASWPLGIGGRSAALGSVARSAPLVPFLMVLALVVLPSGQVDHLSMVMPGLDGAAVAPPSLALLVVTALAALWQGAWLARPSQRARDAGWILALAPLAVSAVRASSPSRGGELGARIIDVGRAASEHMWALLAVLALGVGFGAARTLELATSERARPASVAAALPRAVLALVLTLPLVALILGTSTGVDWVSSWIRWGGCGLAVIVCMVGTLAPERGESRAIGALTFALAVALALLAEREYVEALGHDALAHRDPFDPAVGWARGLALVAVAVEPRERYAPVLALLPAIGFASSWRAAGLRSTGAVLATLVGALVLATGVSGWLDVRAREAAGVDETSLPEPSEIQWSARVLPRTVPFLRAMRTSITSPADEPLRCAGWDGSARIGG